MIRGEHGPETIAPPTGTARPTCGRQVPYQSHGIGYYFTCDLPRGHDPREEPCSGRATDWGAPTI